MKKQTIAIIGAGNVGGALGKGWAACGHQIVYGVTDASDPKHKTTAAQAGKADIKTVSDAAALGDIIALAVPWDAVPDALKDCGALKNKIVIDATNPLIFENNVLSLALGFSTSGGEEIQQLMPDALVFKTMNQVGFEVMSDTQGYATKPVMFIASDHEYQKPTVAELIEQLGFEARNAGPLLSARLLEPYAMVWIDQAQKYEAGRDRAFAFMRKAKKEEITEYVRYELKQHKPSVFLASYTEACKSLDSAPECLGYELTQCAEDKNIFVLRIRWSSANDHMTGFRKGPHFPSFMAAIKAYQPEITEMRHYHPTSLVST